MSGQFASYWNASLFLNKFEHSVLSLKTFGICSLLMFKLMLSNHFFLQLEMLF